MARRENTHSFMLPHNTTFLKSQAEEAFVLPSCPEPCLRQPKAPARLYNIDDEPMLRHPVKMADAEILKQTMMQQEAMFKEQLHELHRLYQVQQSLMVKLEKNNAFTGCSTTPGGLLMHASNCLRRGYGDPSMRGSTKGFCYTEPSNLKQSGWTADLCPTQVPMQLLGKNVLKLSQQGDFGLEQPDELCESINMEGNKQGSFDGTPLWKASHLWLRSASLQKDTLFPSNVNYEGNQAKERMAKSHFGIGRVDCIAQSIANETAKWEYAWMSDSKHAQPTQNSLSRHLLPQTVDVYQSKNCIDDVQFCLPSQGLCASPLMKPFCAGNGSSSSSCSQEPLALFPCKFNECDEVKGLEEDHLRNISHGQITSLMRMSLPQEQMHHLSRPLITSSTSHASSGYRGTTGVSFSSDTKEGLLPLQSMASREPLVPSKQKDRLVSALDTSTRQHLQLESQNSGFPSKVQQLHTPNNLCSSMAFHLSSNCDLTFEDSRPVGFIHESVDKDQDKHIYGIRTAASNTNGSFSTRQVLESTSPAHDVLLPDLNADISGLLEEDLKCNEGIQIISGEVEMGHEGETENNDAVGQNGGLKELVDHDKKMLEFVHLSTSQRKEIDEKNMVQKENVSRLSTPGISVLTPCEETARLTACNDFKAPENPSLAFLKDSYLMGNEQGTVLSSVRSQGADLNSFEDGRGDGMMLKGTKHSSNASCESPSLLRQVNASVIDVSKSNSGNTCQSLDSGLSFSQGKSVITALSSSTNPKNEDKIHWSCCLEDLTPDSLSGGGNNFLCSVILKKEDSERGLRNLGHDIQSGSECLENIADILVSLGLDNSVNFLHACTTSTFEESKPTVLLDSFEVATLMLKPDKFDTGKTCEEQMRPPSKCQPLRASKAKSKRRRMGKDFQVNMLPSLASLSRLEMNQDLQTISAHLKAVTETSLPSRDEYAQRSTKKLSGKVKRSLNQVSEASRAVNCMPKPLKIGSWVDSGRQLMKRARVEFMPINFQLCSPKM